MYKLQEKNEILLIVVSQKKEREESVFRVYLFQD